ncbi:hypothetical protein M8J77_008616 [Diaphorina citri]|nr:hypothetical protein M8J77_008616 [Diaphorina citri]
MSVSPPFLFRSNETTATLDACGSCPSMPIPWYASHQMGEKRHNTPHLGRKKHHGGNHILAAGVLGTVGAAILSALAGKALFASVLAFALAVANLFRSWGGGSSSHGRISTCASPESAATAAILDLNGRKVDLDKYSAIIGVKRSGDGPVGIPVGTLHEIVYKAQSGGSTGTEGGYPHYVTAGGETVQ